MKKVLVVFVLLVCLAGGVLLLLLRSHDVTESAKLVPADAAVYIAIPDVARTVQRWPETAIAKIFAEAGMKDFAARPLKALGAGGAGEAAGILEKLKPEQYFLAVTSVSENSVKAFLGFRYAGDRKSLEGAMERLYKELESVEPAGKRVASDYQGDQVTAFTGGKVTLFSAAHGKWGFLGTSEDVIHQALDRATGRDNSPALDADENFKKVNSHLTLSADVAWFARLAPFIDLILKTGKTAGEEVDPAQLAEIRKLKAAGGSLRFDGADQKETMFLLADDQPKLPMLAHNLMALTTPKTTAFFESVIDLKALAKPEYFDSLPDGVTSFMTALGVQPKDLAAILGGEVGLVLEWHPNAPMPSVLLAATLSDRSQAESVLTKFFDLSSFPVTVSESNGAKVFALNSVGGPLLDPVVAVTDHFLLGALTSAELQRALTATPGGEHLDKAALFSAARSAYGQPDVAFGFVDTKTVFENIYNPLRPVLILAAGMSPNLGKFVDPDKLPETEAISKYLTPLVYTKRQVDDGMLLESSGPITMSQAAVIVGAAAGGAWFMQSMSGLGN